MKGSDVEKNSMGFYEYDVTESGTISHDIKFTDHLDLKINTDIDGEGVTVTSKLTFENGASLSMSGYGKLIVDGGGELYFGELAQGAIDIYGNEFLIKNGTISVSVNGNVGGDASSLNGVEKFIKGTDENSVIIVRDYNETYQWDAAQGKWVK